MSMVIDSIWLVRVDFAFGEALHVGFLARL
jgi:hypothetical protein